MRRARIPWVGVLIGTVVVTAGSVWTYRAVRLQPAPAEARAAGSAPAPAATRAAEAPPGAARRAAPLRLVRDDQPLTPTTAPAINTTSPTTAPATSSIPPTAVPAAAPATSAAGASLPPATPTPPVVQPPPRSAQEAADAPAPATRAPSDPRVAAAQRLYTAGRLLEARQQLNTLLAGGLEADEAEVRNLLTRIADETIFGRVRQADDPLVETYTIRSNDRLIFIGRRFDVPHEIIARINGIRNPARDLRVGQQIRIPRGPFHVKIHKSQFRLDLYLQDLYVRSYRVGIGENHRTPEGVWLVKDRLPNPTYFPPESATDKRIIAADDPENPLGEYWIGLTGVSGAAVGQTSYGIHGTIEPESIGRAVSNGCIRMHNEEVAFIYDALMPGASLVTILP